MKNASPLQHVTNTLPSTLLLVGEKDFPMLEDDARRFVEAAKEIHKTVILGIVLKRDQTGTVRGVLEENSLQSPPLQDR